MLKSRVVYVLVCAVILFLASCSSVTKAKDLKQLNDEEFEAVNSLIGGIYKEVLNGKKCFFYETTYYFMPEPGFSIGENIDDPITILSCACIGSYMLRPETIEALYNGMGTKYVKWIDDFGNERRLRIIKGFVKENPGGAGGGSIYSSNDMATIIPLKVEVY